ncbi:hypothetical protein, partial [Mesorhizobium sp. M7A.F.Ca.US.003.02.1.1]|uniref:hypothetical protein n=1 Tax=Mesorhizobium sp. M7A.F.Ca.US.003.02.1.1 TaxID=2496710 RepID=UPI0019D22237
AKPTAHPRPETTAYHLATSPHASTASVFDMHPPIFGECQFASLTDILVSRAPFPYHPKSG